MSAFNLSPKRRSAAFCIIPGSVEIPTVKRDGTSTRIFCFDSALRKSTLIEIGVRSRYWNDWSENDAKIEVAQSEANRREKEADALRIATAAEAVQAARVPDCDFINLNSLDGIHLYLHQFLKFIRDNQLHSVACLAAPGGE